MEEGFARLRPSCPRAHGHRVAAVIPSLAMTVLVWLMDPGTWAQTVPPEQQHHDWFTVPAYIDGGYRKTQQFSPTYNTAVMQWDSRFEIWLPPSREKFSWGPYLRIAGIAGSQSDAWQNAWLAGPGLGAQVFPFSLPRFRTSDSKVGNLLGPLRAFGEYSFKDYWGSTNQWRPRNETLAGFDYWKAVGVNDRELPWWIELWNGLYWQSSNEFTDRYDSVVFANSVRLGIRSPGHKTVSAITPYILAQSSRTKYDHGGLITDFYWENSLAGGGGLRIAPSINKSNRNTRGVTRFIVYAEYLDTAIYYGPAAPSTVPRYDIRVGANITFADWYK
jgi:hypothetical protein